MSDCFTITQQINKLVDKRNTLEFCSSDELKVSGAIGFLSGKRVSSKHEFKFRTDGIMNYSERCIHCGCVKKCYHE